MNSLRWVEQLTIGRIAIDATTEGIQKVEFTEESLGGERNHWTNQCLTWLARYFEGDTTPCDIPLVTIGTEFQQNVWQALRTIPYGETRTYEEIAIQIGKPNAYRAVGNANNKNPWMILTPCHRVIGKNGKLVGYRGGLSFKEQLLAHEKRHSH